MTILQSGLYCDLCRKPILLDTYWNIKVCGIKGHSCNKCKEDYQEVNESELEAESEEE